MKIKGDYTKNRRSFVSKLAPSPLSLRGQKSWYLSRILWVNAIAILAILLQIYTKRNIGLSLEQQEMILGVINIILRVRTNQTLS